VEVCCNEHIVDAKTSIDIHQLTERFGVPAADHRIFEVTKQFTWPSTFVLDIWTCSWSLLTPKLRRGNWTIGFANLRDMSRRSIIQSRNSCRHSAARWDLARASRHLLDSPFYVLCSQLLETPWQRVTIMAC